LCFEVTTSQPHQKRLEKASVSRTTTVASSTEFAKACLKSSPPAMPTSSKKTSPRLALDESLQPERQPDRSPCLDGPWRG
jgi:hypothetical protein